MFATKHSAGALASELTPCELQELAERVASEVALRLSEQALLVSRNQIASLTSLSVADIDRATKNGDIPFIRRGRRVLYDPQDVVRALKNGGVSNE
ncbi:hypothetical protein [Rosistilla oblonga]|uniref:hypothetical protein n=1 Tax=Rosistilla oblonga TaxID=2527990 RepID=UPI003A97E525